MLGPHAGGQVQLLLSGKGTLCALVHRIGQEWLRAPLRANVDFIDGRKERPEVSGLKSRTTERKGCGDDLCGVRAYLKV